MPASLTAVLALRFGNGVVLRQGCARALGHGAPPELARRWVRWPKGGAGGGTRACAASVCGRALAWAGGWVQCSEALWGRTRRWGDAEKGGGEDADLGPPQAWSRDEGGPVWACQKMLASGGGEGCPQVPRCLCRLLWVMVGQSRALSRRHGGGPAPPVDPGAVFTVGRRSWAQEELAMGSCCESGR